MSHLTVLVACLLWRTLVMNNSDLTAIRIDLSIVLRQTVHAACGVWLSRPRVASGLWPLRSRYYALTVTRDAAPSAAARSDI